MHTTTYTIYSANTIGRRWTNVLSFLLSAVFCIPAIFMINCKFYGMQKSFAKFSSFLVFLNEMNVIYNELPRQNQKKTKLVSIEDGQVFFGIDGTFQAITEHFYFNFTFFWQCKCIWGFNEFQTKINSRCWMGILGNVVGNHREVLVVHFVLCHKFAVHGNVSNVLASNGSVSWYNCSKHNWHIWTLYRLFGE